VKFFHTILAIALYAAAPITLAAESFFRPDDVIALVGGEDMVVAGECGSLELLLQQSLPEFHLKVRNLAWEGDTVFEQPRMLNYPKLEQQLAEIGATVVMMQFGQMELTDKSVDLDSFVSAYVAMIRRLSETPKRRVIIVEPTPIATRGSGGSYGIGKVDGSSEGISRAAKETGARIVLTTDLHSPHWALRDDRHLDDSGHIGLVDLFGRSLGLPKGTEWPTKPGALEKAIAKKNRLWDRYRRPQNWAFLAGDRTTQPSSRDHLDPSKRWFPEEMKEFIPLIEAQEREIWELAAKLAAEKKN
jgi:hypothetical protein